MTCPIPSSTVCYPDMAASRSIRYQPRHVPGARTTCYSENPPATVTTCRPGFFGTRVCQTRHVPGTRTTCYSDRFGSQCETDTYQYCPPIYQRTYSYDPSYPYSPRPHGSAAGVAFTLLALTFLVAICL